MKKFACLIAVMFLSLAVAGVSAGEDSKKNRGADLFKQNCSACHPDGGNIVNPQKTLHKKDRDENNIKKPADIVAKMRNPGPGMTRFDKETIPDKDAKAIAEYILKTFR